MNPSMESIYDALTRKDFMSARANLSLFLQERFGLEVVDLEFQQSAVSLNSFKGVFVAGGERYFFKTHIEQAGEVAEYAGAQALAEIGYPVIAPAFVSAERGKELLVYPLIEDPSLFEVVAALREGKSDVSESQLREGQEALDRTLWDCYARSFESSAPEAFPAVQQLFYRRLAGPRFESFYRGKSRVLGDRSVTFESLESADWMVNGRAMGRPSEWFAMARKKLSPDSMLPFTVVGHGDAHNGNVFFNPSGFRYFDPAYAGRHDPFLDLTKPLFHNTFARWMYFPEAVASALNLRFMCEEGRVTIDHDFSPNAVERMFFESKVQHVLRPLLSFLKTRDLLPVDWQARLQASLLCCPLLTVNLFDEQKYTPATSALGWAMVAEMANLDFNPWLK